ncbi:hypothetical protein [Legionella impletisoli]|nr:hypothetical protein [Legionella impletisoli]
MSQDKSPYRYTEAMIKADLLETYQCLRSGTFPFDQTSFPIYKTDKNGDVVVKDGHPVIEITKKGREKSQPKNLNFQKQMLLELFQMGISELTHIDELAQDDVNGQAIGPEQIDGIISCITDKMDLLGSLTREARLMESVLSSKDTQKQQKFFIRASSLGHQSLLETMKENESFSLTQPTLDKAITIAQANQNVDLVRFLTTWKEEYEQKLNQLTEAFQQLSDSLEGAAITPDKIQSLLDLNQQYEALSYYTSLSDELTATRQQLLEYQLLNDASRTDENIARLPNLMKFLQDTDFRERYTSILVHKHAVEIEQLIQVHERVPKIRNHFMDLIASHDLDTANQYIDLIDNEYTDEAKIFYESNDEERSSNKEIVRHECQALIEEIRLSKIDVKKPDGIIDKYCIDKSGKLNSASYIGLLKLRQELNATKNAVSSPEIQAIKAQYERLRLAGKKWYGLGNNRKADKILDAVCNVCLADRLHVFSKEDNPACNQVRIALASHRIYFTNPVKDGKVVVDDAAKSFGIVQRDIQKRYKNDFQELRGAGDNHTSEDDTKMTKY